MRVEKESIFRGLAVLTAGALGFAGCKYMIGDAYPHPIAGRVDKVSQPEWECHFNAATKTRSDCGYHYYLFVNGCVELPKEAQVYVEEHAPDRQKEYGWVEVNPDVWSEYQEGDYIHFNPRNLLGRIFADQDDQNHPC